MFTGLKPYPEYKASGLPGIERLPVDWSESRLRSVAQLRVSNVDKLSREGETPVQLCNYVDVYKHEFISEYLSFMAATASLAELAAFRLRLGDVLITKDSEAWNDIGVPALVVDEAEDFVSGYHLALLRARQGVLEGEYLLRTLQAPAVAAQLHVAANGVTRFGLSQDDIKSTTIPLPSLPEQTSIAQFLRNANDRIDRAIIAKRQMIGLVEEQKQVEIGRLACGELSNKSPMKESGFAWLGSIPANWEVVRAKNLYREVDERSLTGLEEQLSVSHLTGVSARRFKSVTMFRASSYVGHKRCRPGDLVVNTMWAWMGALGVTSVEGIVSPAYAVYRPIPKEGLLPSYANLLLRTPRYTANFRARSTGIRPSRFRLYPDQFLVTQVLLPPIDEQSSLANLAQERARDAEQATEKCRREIELLREFRTRLTADVVTGQLDVREAAAKLPDLDPAALATVDVDDSDDIDAVAEEFLDGDEP